MQITDFLRCEDVLRRHGSTRTHLTAVAGAVRVVHAVENVMVEHRASFMEQFPQHIHVLFRQLYLNVSALSLISHNPPNPIVLLA